MNRRLKLHEILVELLGSKFVYFQPPETLKIQYPCIVYHRVDIDEKHADNELYNYTIGYLITVIDPQPDSVIPEKVLKLPMCRFDRHFTANNLNHDVFNIYY